MAGKNWSRDEALAAFNVYCRLPFGKLHARNPEIIQIANLLGRSPGSLAMKCCNFASLDPAQRKRGIKGLAKVAHIDEEIWSEFEADPESLGYESESALAKLADNTPADTTVERESPDERVHATTSVNWEDVAGLDRNALVRVRVNQRFFRSMILASYEVACAVCQMPIPSLLVASHIVPWAKDRKLRMNPCNGICLCSLHDRAFDAGILRIDSNYQIRLAITSEDWREAPTVSNFLIAYDGGTIRSPQRWLPDPSLLEQRSRMFA